MRALAFLFVLAACAAPESAPTVEKIRPPWGPMTGATTVEVYGDNFDPTVNRVFIGGREAALVRTIDDRRLDVVIPPGERAGDAEVVVITARHTATATGVFRYSDPPVIESVTPAKVIVSAPPTTITVRGRGFLDEEAGAPLLTLDGQVLADVRVIDDTTLRFEAPDGIAFTRPNIELINQRGATTAPGFRYALDDNPGLLIYASSGEGAFAWFYQPDLANLVTIPRRSGTAPCIYSAMTSAAGEHMASIYCLEHPYAFGRVDFSSQSVVDLQPTNLYYAMVHANGTNYGIDLATRRFGTFEDAGTGFTPISTSAIPGFQFGLAFDRGTMYLAARDASQTPSISTIDPATGARGPTSPLSIFVDVYDMVAFHGLLYAVTSDNWLVTIDPDTGTVTPVVFIGQSFAIDVLE